MKSLLLKQAMVIPLGAMLTPIIIAFFLPTYSSISQHISEVALLDHPIAFVQRAAAIVTGISIAFFGVWLLIAKSSKFTALVVGIFAVSMISNGIFVMGSPLHGLYGIGFFMVLIPAFFAAEIATDNKFLRNISMVVAFVTMTYLWLIISGLDLYSVRGLTQRIATIIIFGWYSVVSYSIMMENYVVESKQRGVAETV